MDEPAESPTISEPMTDTDVEIAKLKEQINDMQSRYEAAIKDYQDANRRLYAHAVGADPEPEPTVRRGPDLDAAASSFYRALGIKENNQ